MSNFLIFNKESGKIEYLYSCEDDPLSNIQTMKKNKVEMEFLSFLDEFT
jgi:hypothetical protein